MNARACEPLFCWLALRIFNSLHDAHVSPQGGQSGSVFGTFSKTLFDFTLRLQPVYEGGKIVLDGQIPFYLKTGNYHGDRTTGMVQRGSYNRMIS